MDTGAVLPPSSGTTPIGGTCDRRFAAVGEAFAANFAQRGEVGAAVCVVVEGRTVVDLWGGWADARRTRPWRADTLVNVFSVGKGLAALCCARLGAAGLLEVDDPVARVWPAFARAGKEAVTVAEVLSHRAGLPAVRRRLPAGAMLDHGRMAGALADQAPWWEPGAAHGYHTNTFGFLVGEIVRRVDGRTLGTVLRQDVAEPLGADVHVGLPDAEHHRVAEFLWDLTPPAEKEPTGLTEEQLMEFNGYFNPSGLSGAGVVNTPEWRRAELPSTNAHASARGVARVYEALAGWGRVGRLHVVDGGTLEAFTAERSNGQDRILHRPSRFGLGFQLTQPERPLGRGARAFGHFGAGGSLGFCDPEAGLAFGYVMNAMGPRWQNPRNRALVDAVSAALG